MVLEIFDVIVMMFVLIFLLISGIFGNGYLSYVVNLYMRCMVFFFYFYVNKDRCQDEIVCILEENFCKNGNLLFI